MFFEYPQFYLLDGCLRNPMDRLPWEWLSFGYSQNPKWPWCCFVILCQMFRIWFIGCLATSSQTSLAHLQLWQLWQSSQDRPYSCRIGSLWRKESCVTKKRIVDLLVRRQTRRFIQETCQSRVEGSAWYFRDLGECFALWSPNTSLQSSQ